MRDLLKRLPLYKRRGREEVFLGILKSKTKNWCGWEYISIIKKEPGFADLLIKLGIYELAVRYWEFQTLVGKQVTFETLMKNYDF